MGTCPPDSEAVALRAMLSPLHLFAVLLLYPLIFSLVDSRTFLIETEDDMGMVETELNRGICIEYDYGSGPKKCGRGKCSECVNSKYVCVRCRRRLKVSRRRVRGRKGGRKGRRKHKG